MNRHAAMLIVVLPVVPGRPASRKPASDGRSRQFPLDFESGGRVFESPRARHPKPPVKRAEAARDAGSGQAEPGRVRQARMGQIGRVVVHGVVPGAGGGLPDAGSTPVNQNSWLVPPCRQRPYFPCKSSSLARAFADSGNCSQLSW